MAPWGQCSSSCRIPSKEKFDNQEANHCTFHLLDLRNTQYYRTINKNKLKMIWIIAYRIQKSKSELFIQIYRTWKVHQQFIQPQIPAEFRKRKFRKAKLNDILKAYQAFQHCWRWTCGCILGFIKWVTAWYISPDLPRQLFDNGT